LTYSQGNPFNRNQNNRQKVRRVYGYDVLGISDYGGPFLSYTVESRRYPTRTFHLKGGNPGGVYYTYDGQAAALTKFPNFTEGSFLQPSSASELDALGTSAIARCIPTNPLAGMGQFLGELRDLPKAPKFRDWSNLVKNARKTGRVDLDKTLKHGADEYLNFSFGIAPFVSDLQKFAKVTKEAAPQMVKFAEGANKELHRQYYFPETTTTTTQVVSSNAYPDPPLSVYLWTHGGVLTKTTITKTKVWFKGCFTYYLPPIDPNDNGFVTAINKAKIAESEANRLYGTRLNVDLIYKLAPWSWAVGWATNANDVVHNWSSFAADGLVMKYGYVMEEKSQRIIYSLDKVGCSDGEQTFVQELVYTTKSRRRATPYGFGVNPASLNAKQWSIIAALGISKQPLSLNF
jgi:hypothetical protein